MDLDAAREMKHQKIAESLRETQTEFDKFLPKDIPRMEGPNTPFEEYRLLPPDKRWEGFKNRNE